MTLDEVLQQLEKAKGKGSWRSLAARMGVSPSELNDAIHGARYPASKILDYLGLEVTIEHVRIYRRKKKRGN